MTDAKIAEISDEKALSTYISQMLKGMKIDVDAFVQDSLTIIDDKRKIITFIEKSGRNIFSYDNNIEVVITPDGIEYLRIKQRKLIKTYDYAPILPAYQILLKNCNEAGLVIDKIDLGYVGYKISIDSKKMTYVAVWRVVDNTGIAKYYRAYTGDEILIY